VTLSIGYQRKRAALGTRWEGPIVSILLAVGGIVVVVMFLYVISGLRVL
jgi:hypothetical protein